MPKLYNADHQAAILDGNITVAPGESHDFTIDEIKSGVAGSWSAVPLRGGLAAEVAFKAERDAPQAPPLHGPGSGEKAWRDYATALGVDVPSDATKALIVAAIEVHDLQDAPENPEANDQPAEPDEQE